MGPCAENMPQALRNVLPDGAKMSPLFVLLELENERCHRIAMAFIARSNV